MDNRSNLGSKNPLSAQRALSGSYALQQQSLRAVPLPSRLHNVRSASQPVPPVQPILDPSLNDIKSSVGLVGYQEQICRSPEVIDLADDDEEDVDELDQRPTKRVKVEGDGHRRGSMFEDTVNPALETVPGSPLPQPPKPRTVANKLPQQKDQHARRHQPARKAHGLEAPGIATRLPSPKNVADFSPWSGQHPEDVLSETAIKLGYSDKSSGANGYECQSAKPIIWPFLSQKNNVGLQALSHLYTLVMEKRLAMGKCTAPSTFRPPPRVTVTDTKREAWLRDLSNPEIPLRKQSRTIPHGIRGKLLMEQCLGKGISMPRAVWLAKCVGANELRAQRRKGMSGAAAASGEHKWIREWTTHVEQFLEGVIASCGQPEWQTKMDYAVKLAVSFYSEHMLERDHYLDWIVSSFSTSTVDKLPVWIILLQLYWKDVTALVKRGRKLAEATLEFLHQLTQQRSSTSNALKIRLQKLVIVLAITRRGCLVLPHTWEKYKHLLVPGSSTAESLPALETPAQNIMKRNERLTQPLSKTPRNTRCALLRLYSALDCVRTNVDVSKLITTASSIIPDPSGLVYALLDWASSLYRTGLSRVYLAASQILRLRLDGHNTDNVILDYMQNKDDSSIDCRKVHHVIAELVRIDGFSPSRYLQWLMTSGIVSGHRNSELATGLLSALPVDALPPQLQNTRQMLLRRITQHVDEVPTVFKICDDILEAVSQPGRVFSERLPSLDRLNSMARSVIDKRALTRAKEWTKEGLFNLQLFCRLRELLQQSRNIPGLSDLIRIGFLTNDMMFLASVIDTISVHAECMAATGHLQALTDRAIERYRDIRQQQTPDRTLILALKSLLTIIPAKASWIRVLENDVTICDQQSSMAVCSPASDNLVSMHISSLDSDDDIDAVFASGNTMDEQLMQRVFARIMQRAGKPGAPSVHAPSKLCAWWNQLRAVDVSGFEQLVRKYIQSGLADANSVNYFSNVVSTLVASTCVELQNVLLLAKETQSSQAASMALSMVLSESVVNEAMHDSENFRFRVQQKHCRLEPTDLLAGLLITALDDPTFSQNTAAASELLRRYNMDGNQHVLRSIITVEKPSPQYVRNCSLLVADLIGISENDNFLPKTISARTITSSADPLSVEFCAAALQFFSKTGHLNNSKDVADLQAAILEAIASGNQVWPQLLEGAGPAITTAIYQSSREKVLAWTSNLHRKDDRFDEEEIQRRLDVLDLTHHASKGDDNGQMLAALTEKVRALESQFPEATPETNHAVAVQKQKATITVMLHLCILYATSTQSDTEVFKQYQGQLLTALCSLILNPQLQGHTDILEFIYDVAACLSDALPDTTLTALSKSLPPTASKDPRIISLLGDPFSTDAWLALASHSGPQTSQQQRVLMKQASNAGLPPSVQQPNPVVVGARPPSIAQKTPASLRAPPQQQQHSQVQAPAAAAAVAQNSSNAADASTSKTIPFPLRRWEMMSDATPTVGENDTSLSLGLFGARRV